ncbi:MAG: hypothetical protein IKE48_01455, partial [Parasporobacterium sp.]|nr:hypothetical protein [Parasporobacterium sp.]
LFGTKTSFMRAIFVQAAALFNAPSPYLAQKLRSCAQFLCRDKNFVHARNFCAGSRSKIVYPSTSSQYYFSA